MKTHDELKASLHSFSKQVSSSTLRLILRELCEHLHAYQREYSDARSRLHDAQDGARHFRDRITAQTHESRMRAEEMKNKTDTLDEAMSSSPIADSSDLERSMSQTMRELLDFQLSTLELLSSTAASTERSAMSVSHTAMQSLNAVDEHVRECLEFSLDQGHWPAIGDVVRHLAGLTTLFGPLVSAWDTIKIAREALEELPQNNRDAAACDVFLLTCELARSTLMLARVFAKLVFRDGVSQTHDGKPTGLQHD